MAVCAGHSLTCLRDLHLSIHLGHRWTAAVATIPEGRTRSGRTLDQ